MSAGNGIRFPRVHAAESVRQRILATFEEMGGVVPGADEVGLAGLGARVGEPYVPGGGVGASVGMDQVLISGVRGAAPAAPPDPASMQAAGRSVVTGGNLVDALAG